MFQLLPEPRELTEQEEQPPFLLQPGITIVLSHLAERGERLAAEAVQTAVRLHGIPVPIQPQIYCPDTSHTIVLAVRGRDEQAFPTVPPSPEAELSEPPGPLGRAEGYTLRVEEAGITVWGASPVGLARGAQTVCQLLATAQGNLPALSIVDAPVLGWRGVMLDVSRGKVPTLATLLQLVDLLACFKLNMLQLYIEHAFASRRHPRIGEGWGALTPEELSTLDTYCRDRYVELVPCLQSFGHLRRILELPAYSHLAESRERWSLAPANEGSYRLLDDLYADHLACFSSRYFNVASDETYDMGSDQSKDLAAQRGLGGLYLDHILRLHEMAARYGRVIMIWDDVFLHYPELVDALPTDAILLNWAYEAAEDYPQVRGFHQAGLQQIVCPGVSSWNSLFARLPNARGNIRNFIAAGSRVGALGMLNTDWGDNGHANLLGASQYGYLYGAAESWSPEVLTDQEFDRRFATLFFGAVAGERALAAMNALSAACTVPSIGRFNGSYSYELFFSDPQTDAHCMLITDEALSEMRRLGLEARALLSDVVGSNESNTVMLDELHLVADQVVFAAERAQLARRIQQGRGASMAVRDALYAELLLCTREYQSLRRRYEEIWLVRNKPEGLWLTLNQLDRAAAAMYGWRKLLRPRYEEWSDVTLEMGASSGDEGA